MSMLANIVGFSLVGLAARIGQLGIQKRNIFDSEFASSSLSYPGTHNAGTFHPDLGGHAISMGAFGYGGYWAWRWDQRAAELLTAKRAEIQERRERKEAAALEA